MAQGRRPDVDTFATLLRWLGMPAESFMRSTRAERGATRRNPWQWSRRTFCSARNIDPEDAEALEEIFRAAYKRLVRQT